MAAVLSAFCKKGRGFCFPISYLGFCISSSRLGLGFALCPWAGSFTSLSLFSYLQNEAGTMQAMCREHIPHLIFAGWSIENLVVEWGVAVASSGVADGKLSPAWEEV